MIRKKAARKTDAYVSRETIDDTDDSDDSDVGPGTSDRRSSMSMTSTRDDRVSTESEPQVLIEEQSRDFPVSFMFAGHYLPVPGIR